MPKILDTPKTKVKPCSGCGKDFTAKRLKNGYGYGSYCPECVSAGVWQKKYRKFMFPR